MKTEECIIKVLAATAFVCGLALSAQAQVGLGWIPTTESSVAVTSNGGRIIPIPTAFPGSGAIFDIPNPIGTAEWRYAPLFPTNTEQLQADLNVDWLAGADGSEVAVLQTGPCLIAVRKLSPPELFDTFVDAISGKTLGQCIPGVEARFNTIYTPAAGTVDVYINGVNVEEKTIAAVPVFNVVGVRAPVLLSSSASGGPAEVTWVNILFWKDGVK
jgi:hypothetical protein